MLIVSEKATKLEKNLQYLFDVIACVKRIWEIFFEYCALFRKHQLKIYPKLYIPSTIKSQMKLV